jgi:HEAT repeat protein
MERNARGPRIALAWLLTAGVAAAHGGSYGGGPGGNTPGFGGPGGGSTPNGGSPKRSSTGDGALDWMSWWEMNRDRFLDLKRVVRGGGDRAGSVNTDTVLGSDGRPPADRRLEARRLAFAVEPALLRGLRDSFWDVQASSLIALGKVGDASRFDLAEIIRIPLKDPRSEVRESAGLALGLLGDKTSIPLLLSIYRNEPAAQALFDNREVPTRQRSLAAIAVGLIGARDPAAADAATIAELVKGAATPATSEDLRIGPAAALGLLRVDLAIPQLSAIAADLEQDADVRAQAIVSLGKIGARSLVPFLVNAGISDKHNAVRRASAIALGLLAPRDDRLTADKLLAAATGASDRMTRNFAIMALAECGSIRGRETLLQLATKGVGHDRAYGALACGVYGFKWRDSERDLAKPLFEEFKNLRGDADRAALALALGLLDCGEAKEAFVGELKSAGSPILKGFICISLGLMRSPKDAAASALIRDQLKQLGDLDLLRRAAVGIGLCRDAAALSDLEDLVRRSTNNLPALEAACTALGMIGGKPAADVLSRIVENKDGLFGNYARTFAAVGLGILGDKDDLSILSRVREHSYYVSPTPGLAEALQIY